ncbi:hypothetical protein GCM10027043_19220 [Ferruginibacter profundus]
MFFFNANIFLKPVKENVKGIKDGKTTGEMDKSTVEITPAEMLFFYLKYFNNTKR